MTALLPVGPDKAIRLAGGYRNEAWKVLSKVDPIRSVAICKSKPDCFSVSFFMFSLYVLYCLRNSCRKIKEARRSSSRFPIDFALLLLFNLCMGFDT